MCTPCSSYVALRLVCPRCAKRSWRRSGLLRRGIKAAIASVFVGAIGATAGVYLTPSEAEVLSDLRARLDARPCDENTLLALVHRYERVNDASSARSVLDRSAASCQLTPRALAPLLRTQVEFYEMRAAITTATRLAELEPTNSMAFYLRAVAGRAIGDPVLAARDFGETLRRDPFKDEARAALHALCSARDASEVSRWADRRQAELIAAATERRSPKDWPPWPDLPSFPERCEGH